MNSNYPLGADSLNAPWHDQTPCEFQKKQAKMEVCPICGAHVTEFIYAFECDECSWMEEKEVQEI